MKTTKKLQTMASPENESDAFNNLLDDLVCHVLSFLPTKMAFRTSVLSKRWASICTHILDFHFNLPDISDPTSSQEIQSVYAVFLRRENHIRQLSLISDHGCQPSDVYHWVLKALDLKVKELFLNLNLAGPSFLPLKLSTLESLVVLKLTGNIQPKFSYCSKVYFPKLKILHLLLLGIKCFQHQVEFTLFPFLSGCPLLEDFLLHDVLINQSIKISFPLLKRLILILRMSSDVPGDKTLQINVPSSLEVLHIFDAGTPIKYECIDFFNVDEATLHINKRTDFDSLHQLLKGISKVKLLYLGLSTIRFLSMEDNLEKLSRLPTFSNLSYFEVHIPENCNWNMLVSFLQNAPKLNSFVIENKLEIKKDGNSSWVVPAEIPTCLSTSLITFEFRGIDQDMKTELNFTRYIINESSKLEKVKIFATKGLKKVRKSLHKGLKKSPALSLDISIL